LPTRQRYLRAKLAHGHGAGEGDPCRERVAPGDPSDERGRDLAERAAAVLTGEGGPQARQAFERPAERGEVGQRAAGVIEDLHAEVGEASVAVARPAAGADEGAGGPREGDDDPLARRLERERLAVGGVRRRGQRLGEGLSPRLERGGGRGGGSARVLARAGQRGECNAHGFPRNRLPVTGFPLSRE